MHWFFVVVEKSNGAAEKKRGASRTFTFEDWLVMNKEAERVNRIQLHLDARDRIGYEL